MNKQQKLNFNKNLNETRLITAILSILQILLVSPITLGMTYTLLGIPSQKLIFIGLVCLPFYLLINPLIRLYAGRLEAMMLFKELKGIN